MSSPMADLARAREVQLSGSLLAGPVTDRARIARRLVQAGHWVHADVIEGSYRGQAGLNRRELAALQGVRDVLDVHLMVDDPVDSIAALPVRPKRLTLQVKDLREAPLLVRLARQHAAQVWIAVEDVHDQDVPRIGELAADGVLTMLTPPGQGGFDADLERLASVRRVASASSTAGVDGGVTAANLAQITLAGATYAVSGRALLEELRQEVDGVRIEHG